jgi:hypothetical protein
MIARQPAYRSGRFSSGRFADIVQLDLAGFQAANRRAVLLHFMIFV